MRHPPRPGAGAIRFRALAVGCAILAWALGAQAADATQERPVVLPPSPWQILLGALPATPPIDAPPFCVLPGLEGEPMQIALEAPKDFGAALERARARLAAAGDAAPRELALLVALLAGRTAADDGARRQAARELAPWLQRRLPPRAEICVRLELARLELWRRHYPEAAAQAVLAARLRSRSRNPAALIEATDFVRAEARFFSRRYQEASEIYRRLSRATSERIAAAARLRLVDARVEQGILDDAWLRYDALLPHAAAFGAIRSRWEIRSVEALLAQGDLQASLERLERLRSEASNPRDANRIHLRIADVLAAQERLREARDVFEAVAEAHPGEPLGTLAEVRAIAWEVDPRELDERIERVAEAARSENRRLAIYARVVQVKLLLERGRAEDALEVLTRLAFEDPPKDLAPGLAGWFDRTLVALAGRVSDFEACATLVEQLGWRRQFLLQQGTLADPFIQLGECYEQLGFAQTAVNLYRSVAKQFSGSAAERVAFPLARAALRAGDLPVARAAAKARSRRGGAQAARWKLLLAEVSLADGLVEPAYELLDELLEQGKPDEERASVALFFARASAKLHRVARDRERLSKLVEELAQEGSRAPGEALGEIALLAAEGYRAAGAPDRARALYQMAADRLPDGVRREEARYWLARTGAPAVPEEGKSAPAPGEGRRSGWSALGEREHEIRALQERIGASVPAAVADEDTP